MKTQNTRIFIVDDHEFFRKGAIMVINRLKGYEIVGEASDGAEFLEKISNYPEAIVLMDIKMPEINGIEASKQALEKYPRLKIIALSMFGDEEYLESMIDAGAMGFLIKNVDKEGLEQALKAVANGNQYYAQELMHFFTDKYFKRKTENNQAKLTDRELEILSYIAKGYTNNEIATELHISLRTVTNHRANLISKTGSKNTVNLLIYAIKNKLVNI